MNQNHMNGMIPLLSNHKFEVSIARQNIKLKNSKNQCLYILSIQFPTLISISEYILSLQFQLLLRSFSQNKVSLYFHINSLIINIITFLMKLFLKGGSLLFMATYLREASTTEVSSSTNKTEEPHSYDFHEKEDEMLEVNNTITADFNLTKLKDNINRMNIELAQITLDPELSKTYFIGPTGSGKSSLINYLLGTQLKVESKYGGLEYHITYESDKYKDRPKIGNEAKSCTGIPEIFKNEQEKKSTFYVDTAGFEDTSGVETEIVNSYALSELFKAGSKVKLAIVITEDSLVAKRGGDLSKIFQRVSQMFNKDMIVLKRSLFIVVTKANFSQQPEPGIWETVSGFIWQQQKMKKRMQKAEQNLKYLIETIVRDNKQMSDTNKEHISSILKTDGLLVFPKAEHINESVIKIIQQRFEKLEQKVLSKKAAISIGPEGQMYLVELEKSIDVQAGRLAKTIAQEIDNSLGVAKQQKLDKQRLQEKINTCTTVLNIIDEFQYMQQAEIPLKIQQIFRTLKLPKVIYNVLVEVIGEYKFCRTFKPELQSKEGIILSATQQTVQKHKTEFQHRLSLILSEEQKQRRLQQQAEQLERQHRQRQSSLNQTLHKTKAQNEKMMEQLRRQLHQLQQQNKRKVEEAKKSGNHEIEILKLQLQHKEEMYRMQLENARRQSQGGGGGGGGGICSIM